MSENPDFERVAFEVARNQVGARIPASELMMSLGITDADFAALCSDALFKRSVKAFAKELTENGTSFALKARVQAEELLKTHFRLATHPDTPPSVAKDMIANTIRWAGLEKKPGDSAGDSASGGPKISINISLSSTNPQPRVINTIESIEAVG